MAETDEGTRPREDDGRALPIASVNLTVTDGPDRGQRFELRRGSARLGSSPGCDVRLSDPTVSRLHCEIVLEPGRAHIVDRGSTNGTQVNGVPVRDADLPMGSVLKLGSTALRVEHGDELVSVPLSERVVLGGLVGSSVAMRRLYAIVERVAPSDATVLVTGETGTGKELVARAVHDLSSRADRAFVAVDCGAVSESLIESELFGHVRGAFSGAVADRKGLFEQAHGGTLFLDEIGELPLALQAKLLRALELGEIRRVGSDEPRLVDVRVVAATNRALSESINEGAFREDLYFRLAVVEVVLPPLRNRREDIPMLTRHFLKLFGAGEEAASPRLISSLMARGWPGNVRELKNFIQRLVALRGADGFVEPAGEPEAVAIPDELVPVHLPLKEAREAWVERFEAAYLRALLNRTEGNVTRAAEIAGVNRRFLHRMMARLGLRSADLVDGDDEE
jgi:transcriptional regulator with PAS, ATPase and Fis domain